MKNKKKIIISLFIIFLLPLLLIGCNRDGKLSDLDRLVESFNSEKLEFKLYYYGKKENLRNLKVTYLANFNDLFNIEISKNTFIVINNLDNELSFDLELIFKLKEKIVENDLAFYYFGNKEIDNFFKSGLFLHENMDSTSLSFGYVKENGHYINVIGSWNFVENEIVKENDKLFLEILLNEFKYLIKLNQ
jgi:hypothetical protein